MEKKSLNNTNNVNVTAIELGQCFKYRGEDWMRAIPDGYIANGSAIASTKERGDAFAVNLRTGRFTAWRKEAMVTPVHMLLEEQY